jgi:hypothetical protein
MSGGIGAALGAWRKSRSGAAPLVEVGMLKGKVGNRGHKADRSGGGT